MPVIGTKEYEGLYRIRLCYDMMSDCPEQFESLMHDITIAKIFVNFSILS